MPLLLLAAAAIVQDPVAVPSGPSSSPSSDPQDIQTAGSTEIVVHGRARTRRDPLVAVNAKTFAVAQDVDKAVVGPVARSYARSVPEPIRDGLRNFLNNTREPIVFLSFLLELKPGKAGETAGRFAINTVAGIAGLLDVAKRRPFNLPRRPNGFGDVLGYHGVGSGPFLFLPLVGPTTVRDAIGGGLDRLILPLAVGFPFNQLAYAVGSGAISALDRRNGFDQELQALRAADDPYVARRTLFLKQRQAEIDGLHTRRSNETASDCARSAAEQSPRCVTKPGGDPSVAPPVGEEGIPPAAAPAAGLETLPAEPPVR